ncbi:MULTISPECIES: hypothetical protein [Cytobacillus]|uniref:Uncharacterized protein n=1 Tax=Cytobacillus oceanisediminis TaxID=665099 RepID=A0ABX3CN92_9BACI|nr:hypothetical protein [Cytobacillus oceanisediminis]MCM3402821.1 hypothetical protein [Cytobacillus oceanisediminis]OHX44607.1 hypothetical protein BBV17_25630 [Cytobacillus oceanisediminis]
MDINELNEKLMNIDSEEQLSILFFKTKKKMRSVLHGKVVETITIKNGYASYTFLDSNIKGQCEIRNLYQYLTF